MFHLFAQLPSQFWQISICPSRTGQTVELPRSKSTQPMSPITKVTLYTIMNNWSYGAWWHSKIKRLRARYVLYSSRIFRKKPSQFNQMLYGQVGKIFPVTSFIFRWISLDWCQKATHTPLSHVLQNLGNLSAEGAKLLKVLNHVFSGGVKDSMDTLVPVIILSRMQRETSLTHTVLFNVSFNPHKLWAYQQIRHNVSFKFLYFITVLYARKISFIQIK